MNRNTVLLITITSLGAVSFQSAKATDNKELLAKAAELIEQKKIMRALRAQLDDQKPAKELPAAEEFLKIKTEKIIQIYKNRLWHAKKTAVGSAAAMLGFAWLSYATAENWFLISAPSACGAMIAGIVAGVSTSAILEGPDFENEEKKMENLALSFGAKIAFTKTQIEEYREKLLIKKNNE